MVEQRAFEDMRLERFAALFAGRTDAYGTITRNDGARSIREVVTLATYRAHLAGRTPMGVYPILDDERATWGCWDFDREGPNIPQAESDRMALIDALAVMEQAHDLGINRGLALELSKRKGAHVWLLLDQPFNAAFLRRMAQHVCALAGVRHYEFFPKQDRVDPVDGLGNYVNLPYFNGLHDTPRRRVMLHLMTRQPLALDEWLETFEPFPVAALEAVADEIPPSPFEPALAAVVSGRAGHAETFPCTPKLLSNGKGAGERNDHAFALALRLHHSSHDEPTRWQFFEQWNGHNTPPLEARELRRTYDSAKKYTGFRCEHPVMEPYCEDTCPIYRHKIEVARLRKVNTRPAIYYLDVKGRDVRLGIDHLYSFTAMAKQTIEQVDMAPPPMKQPQWYGHIQALLKDVEVLEAPREASASGLTLELALSWVYDSPLCEEREDILRGRRYLWRDAVAFRADALHGWLNQRMKGVTVEAHNIYDMLRPLGMDSTTIKIGGRVWRIWTMPKDRPTTESEDDEEELDGDGKVTPIRKGNTDGPKSTEGNA